MAAPPHPYFGLQHVAVKVGDSIEELRDAYRTLTQAGIAIKETLGYYIQRAIHVLDPDGNEVEVFVEPTSRGGGTRPSSRRGCPSRCTCRRLPVSVHMTPAASPHRLAADTWLAPRLEPAGPEGYAFLNSLVIRGEQPVVVDTGAAVHRERWLNDVFSLVGPADVRWVFVSHCFMSWPDPSRRIHRRCHPTGARHGRQAGRAATPHRLLESIVAAAVAAAGEQARAASLAG